MVVDTAELMLQPLNSESSSKSNLVEGGVELHSFEQSNMVHGVGVSINSKRESLDLARLGKTNLELSHIASSLDQL